METEEQISTGIRPVENRWNEAEAANLSDMDLLVYVSRILGAEPNLVLWGGGNTSLKTTEPDFRGRATDVLRVKGSGSNLKTVKPSDFPAVCMDDVLALFERDDMTDEDMVAYLAHTMLDPKAPRPSIETLLHAFVPAKCVLHSHADAILALTNSAEGEEAVRKVFGDEVGIVPYMRPGFLMSKLVGEAARGNNALQGVILMNHGLITWGSTAREAYDRHIALANRAAERIRDSGFGIQSGSGTGNGSTESRIPTTESRREAAARLAPALRGMLGEQQRVMMRYDGGQDVLDFMEWDGAREGVWQGAATPDHILHTKRRALWVEATDPTNPDALKQAAREALDAWQADYRAYFEANATGEPMLPPYPRIILVRGVGMFTAWKDAASAQIPADIFHHTIGIIRGAEVFGGYRSLSDHLAFINEYWPLELYKLSLAPPEKEMSRRVAVVTGAAGALGAGIARRFGEAGAHVVCADIDLPKASALVEDLNAANPKNRGMAVAMDVTDEASVRSAFNEVALAYGGVDILVSNAGFATNCPIESLSLADWQRSFAVNATGHFVVAREAVRVLKEQGTGGSLVFIATKNVTAPGKDFGAYSAAKAAEAQLAKILALEAAPYGVRSNMVNPDAVFEGSGLWSPEVVAERAQSYGIAPEELPDFYRKRNLLRVQVTAADVAEAAFYFASDRSARTTGAMLPVDGGLKEAFPR